MNPSIIGGDFKSPIKYLNSLLIVLFLAEGCAENIIGLDIARIVLKGFLKSFACLFILLLLLERNTETRVDSSQSLGIVSFY